MLVLEQGMALQLGQSRQGRGTAEFQNHQKNAKQGLGSSKCWFWNCSKLDGIYLRVMVRSAFKKCTPDSREGSTFLMQPVLLRNFPDPGTAT